MRLLIVEDEEIVARRLVRLIESILQSRIESLEHVGTIEDALDAIDERAFDIIFLDLNLDGRDGFRILGTAAAGAFQTIIVSAHADQAIRAFEYGVVDFVPKPFGRERLRKAIDRATRRDATTGEHLRRLAVRKQGEIRFVPIETVLWISGAGDYAEIHCDDGSTHLHDKSLTSLEMILPSRFERVHRSHIADVSRAKRLRSSPGSRYRLQFDNGAEIPVSRTAAAKLRESLRSSLEPSFRSG